MLSLSMAQPEPSPGSDKNTVAFAVRERQKSVQLTNVTKILAKFFKSLA